MDLYAVAETQACPAVSARAAGIGRWRGMVPWLYMAPALAIFTGFTGLPLVKTIWLSLHATNMRGEARGWTGLENYVTVLTSPDYPESLRVTLLFVLMTVLPSLILGLALALLAHGVTWGRTLTGMLLTTPMAVSSAVAGLLWGMLFHPDIGALNRLFHTHTGWLTDPRYALTAVSLVTVWMHLGANIIFLLAGLRQIPAELLESARIDGAGYGRTLWRIILPMLSPTLFFVIFMNMMGGFQSFAQINLLTGGGPGHSTHVLVFSVYREAFFNGRFDTASAQSMLLFVLMLGVALLQFRFEDRGVHTA